jgi:hypothetical protein
MKRVVGIGILLNIIALSCLAKMASPAFAATNRASAATHAQASINIARAASRELQALPAWRHPRQNNQSFVGFSEFGRTAIYWGHNQNNTGNQGVNWGNIQDNGSNRGNLINDN